MIILRFIKKGFWCLVAALASVLAWFTNIFQLVRNTLLLVLDLPGKVLTAATVFVGVVYGIACFFMGSGLLNTIGNIAGGCLVLFLAYKIFNFVYMLGYALIGSALNFFDFDRVTNFFAALLQKAIHGYMNQIDDPIRFDRIILFGIPWLIHKINWIFEKLSSVIRVATYIVFGSAGIYFSCQWVFADISDYSTVDYIIGCAMVIVITCISIWLGSCVAQAIRMATESVRPLDELFSVYAEFFRNAEEGNSGNCTNDSTGSGSSWSDSDNDQYDYRAQYTANEDNPYHELLNAAQSAEELQKLYRGLAKKLHPDVCKDYSVEEATRRMAQLNNAYEQAKRRF